eukprot:m.165579 g.165579  ORF g.165579 m.165579 type:complete len:70 (+) comp24002_c0_seq4:6612-6821(+)
MWCTCFTTSRPCWGTDWGEWLGFLVWPDISGWASLRSQHRERRWLMAFRWHLNRQIRVDDDESAEIHTL